MLLCCLLLEDRNLDFGLAVSNNVKDLHSVPYATNLEGLNDNGESSPASGTPTKVGSLSLGVRPLHPLSYFQSPPCEFLYLIALIISGATIRTSLTIKLAGCRTRVSDAL